MNALSWLVGITGSCLAVGLVGLFAADLPPIHLKTLEDEADSSLAMVETSMAELQTLDAEETVAQDAPELPVEIPEAVEAPPESLDLPEIAEAMTMEDIFAIPTAPPIQDALKPVDPVVKPKPRPTPHPRPQSVARSSGTGYSTLGSYASAWVRRNWRWPGGAANRYPLPLTFRLR
ncbi:MAG: hypothetical protein JNM65_18710 [Verrucomicrobiaceae bacterium]|nr:hypothetical protein [Verrucomicrobiaceae bacterium]